jgi:hypothetical protein
MPFTTEFTQAQVDALSKQIALGVREVWHNGKKTQFQTIEEMLELRDRMKLEIAAAAPTPAPMPSMTRPTVFWRN